MLDTVNLRALNSATQYPSIPTYHVRDPARGRLTETHILLPDEPVNVMEKVDGANSRIIKFPSGEYVIGSRQMLLTARGDRIFNPMEGIVETLRPIAERLAAPAEGLEVYYFEVYGGAIGKAWRQYTADRKFGAQLFDIARIPVEMLEWGSEFLASWRDGGGQDFLNDNERLQLGHTQSLVPVPRLVTWAADRVPTGLEETYLRVKELLPRTYAALDQGAGGEPEGVVVRTADRSSIVKIRFEDYEKALKPARRI